MTWQTLQLLHNYYNHYNDYQTKDHTDDEQMYSALTVYWMP